MDTFKFTTEQLRQIYEGDIDARNTFYFDNLDIITRMAYSAMQRERHPVVTVDDLIQGVYADMDYFCEGVDKPVTDEHGIIFFLRWSFHLAPYGGLAYCREHNPKITAKITYSGVSFFDTTYTDKDCLQLDCTIDGDEGGKTYGEIIPDTRAELTEHEDYTDEFIKVFGEYLTPKMREVFALAMYGYDGTRISEMLGLNRATTYTRMNRLCDAFAKHLDDVVKTLAYYGIYAEGIAERAPKRFYKTSEKQRARQAKCRRLKRERRRAESIPNDVA